MRKERAGDEEKGDEAGCDSRSLYQQLFTTMAQGAFVLLPDGALGDCNPALLTMLGLTRAEFLGGAADGWEVIRADGTRVSWRERPFMRVLATRQPVSDELAGIINPRKESCLWVLLNAIPLFDADRTDLCAVMVILHDVTAQRQTEEALQVSEEKYRAFYESAPLAYQSLDEAGLCMDVNPGWLRLLGYERSEVIGKWFGDFMHPDWKAHFEKNFPAFKARGYVNEAQFKIRHKSGRYIFIELSGCIGYLPDGSFRQTYCFFHDVTQRKRAEQKLVESEQTHRELLRSLDVGVIVHAPDTTVLIANPAACRLLGVSEEQISGRGATDPIWRFLREDRSAMPTEEYPVNQIQSTGAPLHNQVIGVVRPDSAELTWVLVNGFGLAGGPGPREQVVVSLVDITERENATEMLEKERQRMAGILKGTNAGTWEWNVQTGNIIFNKRWAEMIGYSLAELSPLSFGRWKQLCHPDDLADIKPMIKKHLRGELEHYEVETRLKHKNGQWVWVLMSGRVVKWTKEGRPLMMMGTQLDINETHHMRERLRQTEKMDAIGQLAGGVAHDFNNQLAGILGYADLLVAEASDPALIRYAERIIKASERAAKLTEQLLAFGRKGKHLNVPVELHRVIGEVTSMLERSIDKRIRILQDLHAQPSLTKGDPAQIYNALLNLGINARDAMPDGGQLIYATESVYLDANFIQQNQYACAPGAYVCIRVTDTGSGMSRETQRKAFEPFFTTKSAGKGTGLGLSSVYGTIRNHGGTISVYSELDTGTTFRIYLPVADSQEPAEEITGPVSVKGSGRILLVDDEPVLRELGVDMLRSLGYQADACKDGQEALEYYEDHWREIDLVILDMIMPRLDGRSAFTAMRQINPDIRAILSSGYSVDGKAQAILDDGVRAFVGKPFSRRELAAAIERALSGDSRQA